MHELSSAIPVALASRRGLALTRFLFVLPTIYHVLHVPKELHQLHQFLLLDNTGPPRETQPFLEADLTRGQQKSLAGFV